MLERRTHPPRGPDNPRRLQHSIQRLPSNSPALPSLLFCLAVAIVHFWDSFHFGFTWISISTPQRQPVQWAWHAGGSGPGCWHRAPHQWRWYALGSCHYDTSLYIFLKNCLNQEFGRNKKCVQSMKNNGTVNTLKPPPSLRKKPSFPVSHGLPHLHAQPLYVCVCKWFVVSFSIVLLFL